MDPPELSSLLRKEKQDTLGAVADLAEELGVPERAFSYAGLKDYHAITTQELVVQGVPPSRVPADTARGLRAATAQVDETRAWKRRECNPRLLSISFKPALRDETQVHETRVSRHAGTPKAGARNAERSSKRRYSRH